MSTVSQLQAGSDGCTIGQYVIKRLQDYGLQDIFGIPGDYVLSFYKASASFSCVWPNRSISCL